MVAKSHMVFSSAILLSVDYFTKYSNGFAIVEIIMFYLFVIIGSVLPDIDESNSYIGKKIPILSIILSSLMRHKTFTHYLIVPVLLFCIGYFFIEDHYSKIIILAISIGILLHDIGDMFTMNGIKSFLFPFFINSYIVLAPKFLRFQTNGTIEHTIYFIILLPLNLLFIFIKVFL